MNNKDKAKGTINNFKMKYKFKLRKEAKLRWTGIIHSETKATFSCVCMFCVYLLLLDDNTRLARENAIRTNGTSQFSWHLSPTYLPALLKLCKTESSYPVSFKKFQFWKGTTEKCFQLSHLQMQDNVNLLRTSQLTQPPMPLPATLQPITWTGYSLSHIRQM